MQRHRPDHLRHLLSELRVGLLHAPAYPPARNPLTTTAAHLFHARARSYGFFTAINASHATWSFKTIKADGPGPADYSDSLTIVQSNHGPRA